MFFLTDIYKPFAAWELDFCGFAPLASGFLFYSQKKVTKEKPPQTLKLLFKQQNKSTFFTPDFCGCCGTHELKSQFAQTSSQKTPQKSLLHQLESWGDKIKNGKEKAAHHALMFSFATPAYRGLAFHPLWS